MKLLHVDSSILGDNSVSRKVSAAIVAHLVEAHPDTEVTTRDLAAHTRSRIFPAPTSPARTPRRSTIRPSRRTSHFGGAALAEFLASDTVVIGCPMYNFGIPSQLKAWIDRILVAGKTFRYTEKGPEGLAGGKRVIVAASRGGFYGADSPRASCEHQVSYLHVVFDFMGVGDVTFIEAEGIATGPEQREKALAGALDAAGRLAT